ncbi:MAG TPA: DUF1517 domain-containing protein [Polyangiaceae bacterium LLY-WYZ-15_(1-7)]|nr:DUF1517 domain-containing protein [Polyangiaceae bacterium LLY-WYZ-15_(1-7)]
MPRSSLVALGVLLAGLVVTPADAQRTGGSFGGSSWGSSSRSTGSSSWGSSSGSSSWGSSSGSSSWGSSSSSGSSSSWGSSSSGSSSSWGSSSSSGSSGSHSYGASSGGGGGGPLDFVCPLVLLAVLGLFFFFALKSHARPMSVDLRSVPETRIDVSVVMLAIDWRARRFVQDTLDELAQSGDTSSPMGLLRLLSRTVATLRESKLAWIYAGAYNARPMAQAAAQQQFQAQAAELRARFRHELIRNADGSSKVQGTPELRAREEEGQGVVVVSLMVAAKKNLADLQNPRDARALDGILASLPQMNPFQLVALEVIWSPAAEDDRMSTAELEVLYPELKRIDEGTMAGRIFCGHCSGPYAAELLACPHCGAPAPKPESA